MPLDQALVVGGQVDHLHADVLAHEPADRQEKWRRQLPRFSFGYVGHRHRLAVDADLEPAGRRAGRTRDGDREIALIGGHGPLAIEGKLRAGGDRQPPIPGDVRGRGRIDGVCDDERFGLLGIQAPALPRRDRLRQPCLDDRLELVGIERHDRLEPVDQVADVVGIGASRPAVVRRVGHEHEALLPTVRSGEGKTAGVGDLGGADEKTALPQRLFAGGVGVDGCPRAAAAAGQCVECHRRAEGRDDRGQRKDEVTPRLHAEAPAERRRLRIERRTPGLERRSLHAAIGLPRPAAAELRVAFHARRCDRRERHLLRQEKPSHPDLGIREPERIKAPGRLHKVLPRPRIGGIARRPKPLERCRGDETGGGFQPHEPARGVGGEHRNRIEVGIPSVSHRHLQFGDVIKRDPLGALVVQDEHAASAPAERPKENCAAIGEVDCRGIGRPPITTLPDDAANPIDRDPHGRPWRRARRVDACERLHDEVGRLPLPPVLRTRAIFFDRAGQTVASEKLDATLPGGIRGTGVGGGAASGWLGPQPADRIGGIEERLAVELGDGRRGLPFSQLPARHAAAIGRACRIEERVGGRGPARSRNGDCRGMHCQQEGTVEGWHQGGRYWSRCGNKGSASL